MNSAPELHFGLRQIQFVHDYPTLDVRAQCAIEGRDYVPVSYGGIDRSRRVRWSTETKYWGLPPGYPA